MQTAPKRFGDSLNEWFRALGRAWKPLLLSSLVVHVPLAVVVMSYFLASGAADSFATILDPEALEDMTGDEVLDVVVPLLWPVGIWSLLQVVAGVFVYVAGARVVAGHLAGSEYSWLTVSRFAATRLPAALVVAFVVLAGAVFVVAVPIVAGWAMFAGLEINFLTVFLTTTLALTALVVLVWLGVSVSLAIQVVAIEGASPLAALSRSFTLVRDRWWATIGFLLVIGIITSAVSQVASLPLIPIFAVGALIPEALVLGLSASVVLQGPLLAAIAAGYALWYIDLRARREDLASEDLF
jgi:hypothetical protein